MSIVACDFLLEVSVWDLVDEIDGELISHPVLDDILREKFPSLDLLALCNYYSDEVLVGRGDVFLHRSSKHPAEVVVIDLYKNLQDQQDLIRFGLICSSDSQPIMAEKIVEFFASCTTQAYLGISVGHPLLRDLINPSMYPRKKAASDYSQKLICV